MTRKDYIKIADILKDAKLLFGDEDIVMDRCIDRLITDFCKMLTTDSIKFNESKFLQCIKRGL